MFQELKIEKDVKSYFESALNRISSLLIIKSTVRQLILELMQHIKQLYQSKLEARIVGSKLAQME